MLVGSGGADLRAIVASDLQIEQTHAEFQRCDIGRVTTKPVVTYIGERCAPFGQMLRSESDRTRDLVP